MIFTDELGAFAIQAQSFNFNLLMQQMLQDFLSVSDHFGILCIKGLMPLGTV